ncbi:MAG TPA: cation:proton antiporter [Thermoplasmata archaeon]|nr:cation:proton antiporter [Thermoplasmata archaeon]
MNFAEVEFVEDLAIILLIALGMALLFRWIRQPIMIGYIVAGMIIGPYTPPFSLIHYPQFLNALAEMGIVFLLFAVGLEYPIARLRAVGSKALVIALSESLATFTAGFLVGEAWGFPVWDALFIGLAISVTSTVIVSSVLQEIGLLRSPETTLVLGVTVIEDIVTVTLLGVLQSTAQSGHLSIVGIGIALGLVVLFIGAVLSLGPRTISPLIDRVNATRIREVFLLAILGIAFAFSLLSSLIGISVATGAFLAGVLVAESNSQAVAHEVMAPLKELFGAIFFVSMGALMNVALLPIYLLPILAFLATAVGVKVVATYVAARRERVAPAESRRTAITLSASGGELALVVAKGGADIGATNPFVLPFIGALTVVTTVIAPYLIRFAWKPVLSASPGSEPVRAA